MYMFDSCILIDLSKRKLPIAYELLMKSDASLFKVPAVVKAKLMVDAEKAHNPEQERLRVETLLLPFEIVPFDGTCAIEYARIRAHLEREGKRISDNDYLIAATALAHSAILVTNNVDEFKRVPGLTIEEWAEVDF